VPATVRKRTLTRRSITAVSRVALATCAEVPDLDPDDRPLLGALAERGVEAAPAVWDDPEVDWDAFDLVVLRSTWDYAERRDAFLRWIDALPRVLNSPPVVRWNTDKHYLAELAAAGVAVVPTTFVEPGGSFEPPPARFVVKPAVSAGGRRSASYDPGADAARHHVAALHAAGDTAIVQPYVSAVDEGGETALLYLGGRYSHAIAKAALLAAPPPAASVLYLPETIDAREATPAERVVAEQALEASPFRASDLLYARVDIVPGDEGPRVLEVELTEPSLYLAYADGAGGRLADAIAHAVGR
jgi:glutathione synthase/RimK-type ligase-like ATP-grasp enzyme